MEIQITSPNSLYVTIGDYTYYIDNSTGEHIVDVTNNITNETTILN